MGSPRRNDIQLHLFTRQAKTERHPTATVQRQAYRFNAEHDCIVAETAEGTIAFWQKTQLRLEPLSVSGPINHLPALRIAQLSDRTSRSLFGVNFQVIDRLALGYLCHNLRFTTSSTWKLVSCFKAVQLKCSKQDDHVPNKVE